MSAYTPCPEVQVFDLRDEPVVLARRKWTPHVRRDPADLKGVVLHSWGTKVGTTAANRLRYGSEAAALAYRCLEAPYLINAGVTSAGDPIVVLAHPVERYTYASDAGNVHFAPVALMENFPFEWPDVAQMSTEEETRRHYAMVAAVDAALRMAHSMLPSVDAYPLITHRQCANEPTDHFRCPGEGAVAMACTSQVVADGLLVPDPDLVILPEFGKTWPGSWRRHLLAPPAKQLPIDLADS